VHSARYRRCFSVRFDLPLKRHCLLVDVSVNELSLNFAILRVFPLFCITVPLSAKTCYLVDQQLQLQVRNFLDYIIIDYTIIVGMIYIEKFLHFMFYMST